MNLLDVKTQIFKFDKVINESYSSSRKYNSLFKEITNMCCIMFGPTDPNEKTLKLSKLLTTKSSNNMALEAISEILSQNKQCKV